MCLLRVEQVTKRYAAHTALDDVSLEVPRGAVYGLLGPNGAGKTTLIRIINRITAPDSGRVFFDGRPLAPDDIYRIGYLPEERGLYKKMRVGEQALYFAQLKGLSKREATERLRAWFEKFGIAEWWDRKVEELSKGMAQKIQFIITVLHRPALLIFDEPFSGFDPINANLLKNAFVALRDSGATVIFSTHNMSSVEEICDHITLIDRSRNVLSGAVGEIRRRYGESVFRIDFAGDPAALSQQELQPYCSVLGIKRGAPYHTAEVRLVSPDAVRPLIGLLNERTELHGFSEVIPGMNDIFIRAVNGQLEQTDHE